MAILFGADKLSQRVRADIDSAERYFDTYIADKIITRYQLLQGSKEYYNNKFARLSKQSTYVDSSIADAIDWIMPSLMELFFGSNKIVSLTGMTDDDDPYAMEKLIEWQIMRQNKGFMIGRQFIEDSLKAGAGALKVAWVREKSKEKQWVTIDARQMEMVNEADVLDARINGDGTYSILVKQEVMGRNFPRLINLMPGSYLFSPQGDQDGRRLFECDRRYMTRDEILRMADMAGYDKKQLAIALMQQGSGSDKYDAIMQQVMENDASDADTFRANPVSGDKSRDVFMPYDCIGRYGIDDSGKSVWVHATYLNDTCIRGVRYPYEQSNYIVTKPYNADYQVWGHGIADLMQDLQDLQTALMRQIIVNVALNNERRVFFDESQTDGILAYNAGALSIPIKVGPQGKINDLFGFAPHAPLSPETFTLSEMLTAKGEQRTGVTRYNQGLDSESLNKTATGISRIMNASQQRIRMIARVIAETGFEPLFRIMVEMNQKHIEVEQVIRLTNESMTIRPDDLEGKFDIEVSAGIGAVDQQAQIQNMMMLMQGIMPQLMPLGLATKQNIYNVGAKIVENMGYRNVDDFISDPSRQERMMAQTPGLLPGQPMTGPTPDQVAALLAGNSGGEVTG